MELEIIRYVVAGVQVIGAPVIAYIALMVRKNHKAGKLQDFKIDALVHSIQKNFVTNGFTKCYTDRVKQLMEEHNFIYKP